MSLRGRWSFLYVMTCVSAGPVWKPFSKWKADSGGDREKEPAEFIPGSCFRVQIQGQPVNSIRIDKYDVVEFRGEGSVEE